MKRADGRGHVWSNSLFEDNAEFGYGMRLAADKSTESARELLTELSGCSRKSCKPILQVMKETLVADQSDQAGIEKQRECVDKLKKVLRAARRKLL